MTEAQADKLAWAIVKTKIVKSDDNGLHLAWVEAVDAIKVALMSAYNDGWENGFEEGREFSE